MPTPEPRLNPASLNGVRVWLSASLPEPDNSSEEERQAVLEFVKRFSARVFQLGGHIIHGSHPSIVPTLLAEAKRHQQEGGKKDALILAVSRHWSKDPKGIPLNEWRQNCLVYETPEAGGENAREESLKLLRGWMAARSDAIVVIGGRWWQQIAGRAGLPVEINLAVERGIASFILGGAAGAARDYIKGNQALLAHLKNGFSDYINLKIATELSVADLAEPLCEQLAKLPLVRGKGSDGVSFRILALDGGGIKGTFTASVLATWEQQTGLRVADHFDLIAGTSTGGILAIGLGLGLSAKEMLEFYRKRGPIIFPITSLASKWKHKLRHLFTPKYSQTVLLRELQSAYYPDGRPIVLKESKCRLIIPAYHAIAGSSHIFRTPHHELMTSDATVEAAHAALATAAAPTFFAAAKVGNLIAEANFFDGGVWANSPALAAIVEATCFLNIPLDRIDVLSVGTTEEPFTVSKKSRAGVIRWGKKLIDVLMNAQSEASQKHARLLAGDPRFLRINVQTQNGSYKLDSPGEIEELAALGNNEASKPEILSQVRSRFLNGVLASPWENFG